MKTRGMSGAGLLLGTLASVGCSSSDGGGAVAGDCAQRSGTYADTYVERSGNCGAISEEIITIDEQPTEPEPPCTGEISYSMNNCRVTFESDCPAPGIGAGYRMESTGVADWNSTGNRGTAVVQVTVFDASDVVECRSTYDLTSVRQ